LSLLGVLLFATVASFGEEPSDESDVWSKAFLEAAKSYELVGEKETPLKLVSRPILNWTNPERNTKAGSVFLWTNDGLPAAAMCIYPSSETTLDHEFQSLSTTSFQASLNSRVAWKPTEAGITYESLPDVRPPGKAGPIRLTQMRVLAREFAAGIVKPNGTQVPLRLLPTPLYRYPESETPRTVVDGAVFAFVQGTDPEVLLMIESALDEKGAAQWRFALARMSMVPLEVIRASQVVWKTDWAREAPDRGYYTIHNIPAVIPGNSE
jgi:hypothetical protein